MSGFYGQTAPAPALAPAQPSAPTQVSGKTGNYYAGAPSPSTQVSGKTGNYYTGSPNPSTATTGNGFAPPPAVKALAPGQTMTPTGGAGFHGGSGAASPLPGAGPSSPTRPSMATTRPSTATTGNGFAPPPAVKTLAPGQTMTPTGGSGFYGGSGAASPLPGAGPSSPTRPSMASAPGVPNSRYHVTPGNPFTDPSRGIYVGEIPSTPTGPQHWMPAVRR